MSEEPHPKVFLNNLIGRLFPHSPLLPTLSSTPPPAPPPAISPHSPEYLHAQTPHSPRPAIPLQPSPHPPPSPDPLRHPPRSGNPISSRPATAPAPQSY